MRYLGGIEPHPPRIHAALGRPRMGPQVHCSLHNRFQSGRRHDSVRSPHGPATTSARSGSRARWALGANITIGDCHGHRMVVIVIRELGQNPLVVDLDREFVLTWFQIGHVDPLAIQVTAIRILPATANALKTTRILGIFADVGSLMSWRSVSIRQKACLCPQAASTPF